MFQNNHKTVLLAAAMAALICLLLFLPAVRCGFVNVDDPDYVLNNPLIRQLDMDTLGRLLFQSHLGWWMPLTWVSFAIDYRFWGLDPAGYHLTNIILHAMNTGMVVLAADAFCRGSRDDEHGLLSGKAYAGLLVFSGLFFGLHPLRVESVAWVTERKDVLNGLFAAASLYFYLQYVLRKEMGRLRGRPGVFYALSLLCFVCSLMAKSVTVVLPALFLVLDWAPLGRLRCQSLARLVGEKAPYIGVSALMALSTLLFAAKSEHLVTYEAFPFAQRLVVSGNAVWEYVRMTIVPFGLSPFNVIPDPIPVSYTVKTVLVVLIIAGIFVARKSPATAACVACFLLPLLPVLAFFQNGDQSYADRFTYLPSLAMALFLARYLDTRSWSSTRLRTAAVAGICLLSLYLVATLRQIDVWKNTETYWTRVIAVDPLAISYKERGRYYHGIGRYDEAVADFSEALRNITPTLKPYAYNLYAFRGESLRAAGRLLEAVDDFSTAIAMHPHPAYYHHRGLALQAMGRNVEANEDFRRAGPDTGPINWIE